MDRKGKKLYQNAELAMANHSLKEFNLDQFERNFIIHLNYFDVLTRLFLNAVRKPTISVSAKEVAFSRQLHQ